MYTAKELAAPVVPEAYGLSVGALFARFGVKSMRELRDLIGVPIQIRYKGLVCFGEASGFPSVTEGGSADEPYLLIATITRAGRKTERFPQPEAFFEDVDGGDSRNSPIAPTFLGRPVSVGIFIHLKDSGSFQPERLVAQAQVEVYRANLDLAADAVQSAARAKGLRIPEDCEPLWNAYRTQPVANFGDRTVDYGYVVIPVESLARMPDRPLQSFKAIDYHLESPLLAHKGASYKVYFDVIRT